MEYIIIKSIYDVIKKGKYFLIFLITISSLNAQKILIPMDLAQTDHLKAYGITYWVLKQGQEADWLLNYRGGSFMTDYTDLIAAECRIRGVFFETIDGATAAGIYAEVQGDNVNMDVVRLEKAPKVAVYAPPNTLPWDDAVRLVLDYAEVPHDIILMRRCLQASSAIMIGYISIMKILPVSMASFGLTFRMLHGISRMYS